MNVDKTDYSILVKKHCDVNGHNAVIDLNLLSKERVC